MRYFLNNCNSSTTILISLSIILFSGFIVTRLTKLIKLPNVSGFIIAGILIGPCVLNVIPSEMVQNLGFLSDIALAFIAFGVGKFFKKDIILKAGSKIIIITIFESLFAGILITLSMHYIFKMDMEFSLLLGAIATATAPASTMMTIKQYHARGEFIDVLLQVVAFDDVICLFVFSIVSALVMANTNGAINIKDIALPIIYNVSILVVGFVCGLILSKLLSPRRSSDNRLILVVAMLLSISGICAMLDISPLLACMVFGATYINLKKDKELFDQIDNFTPPIMSMFFIVSGMYLDINALASLGIIGVGYFFIRILGKYLGAFLGCHVTRYKKSIRNYLGVALIPQAGVSIGLAFLGQRILPGDIGSRLLNIILASSVLYEIIGPACAKISLFLSGTIKKQCEVKDNIIEVDHKQAIDSEAFKEIVKESPVHMNN